MAGSRWLPLKQGVSCRRPTLSAALGLPRPGLRCLVEPAQTHGMHACRVNSAWYSPFLSQKPYGIRNSLLHLFAEEISNNLSLVLSLKFYPIFWRSTQLGILMVGSGNGGICGAYSSEGSKEVLLRSPCLSALSSGRLHCHGHQNTHLALGPSAL